MTALPSDPQPESTPGLDAGGGVRPGDTPPGEASTSGVSHQQESLPSRRANTAIAVALVAVIVLASVAVFAGRLANLW